MANFEEEFDDFEDWEVEYYLIQNNDYDGLVKHREIQIAKNPDDIYARLRLGEAYVMNKEYEKALENMRELHVLEPDSIDVQYIILDALFGQGKDVDDFDWQLKPDVISIERSIAIVAEMLQNKRKHRPACEIYTDLMSSGYLKFTEEMLFEAMSADDRFDIQGDTRFWHGCAIKLKVKRVK